jgi:signal transduction histidine kinase/CheY-like chemotaxis protein
MGTIAVQNYEDENAYTEEDLEILEIVAKQISIALERKKHEEDLKNALDKAQESDRLKSAFLANMSHEIRTPMNSILGFTDLLQNPSYTDEQKHEFIDIIQISGKRMLNTINDIIDISKIETGQMTISYKTTNVNKIIKDIHKQLGLQANQKGIEFNYKLSLDNPEAEICTDEIKFNSILTNLVKNAIKYTDKGSVLYGYEVITEKDNPYLKFFVKDTGIGIPDKRKEAIFNPFEQADIEDFEARQGSGLGLSIAKAYTEMLNGKIWFDSTLGKGSTFYFTLPYSQCKTIPEKEIPKQKSKVKETYEQKKIKILIAEDNDTNIQLLSFYLAEFKPEILIAKNGKIAVEIAKNHPDIDIILMDIKMPVMDGYEATEKIREFNKDVTIIAQTAYALTGDDLKTLKAGCNDYISKPIDKDKLLKMINKTIKSK